MKMTSNLIRARYLLRKKIILISGDICQSGVITQIFLHPSKGKLLGFELRTETCAAPLRVAIDYLLLNPASSGEEQIVGLSDSFSFVEAFVSGATSYQEFGDTEVVTEAGDFCGRIKEVYFEEEGLQTIYQIKVTGWRGIFRKSYFIKGNRSNYYSPQYHRLVLPVETPHFSSLTAVAEYLQLSPPLALSGERPRTLLRLK